VGRKLDVTGRDDVLGTVPMATPRGQPAALVPIVVERDDRNRFTDDEAVAGGRGMVLESLAERLEFLVVAMGIARDLPNEIVHQG